MNEGLFDAYFGLDLSSHSEGAHVDGREITLIHNNFGGVTVLAGIEQLVDQVIHNDRPAFELRPLRGRGPRLMVNLLGRQYERVRTALREYQDGYVYSVKVYEFFEACRAVGLRPGDADFDLGYPLDLHLGTGRLNYQLFNALIDTLRTRVQGSRYRLRLRRFERNCRRRVGRVLAWEQGMFEWRSRHGFLMLILGYRPEIRQSVTSERVQADLSRFLNNRRTNKLLGGIDGYVAKIEEGDKSGLHVHILIAYAPVTRDDIGIARRIGEYWRDVVTQGEGSYWNSNVDKARHARWGHGVGTGLINQFDMQARESLRSNLRYLAKSDQHLRKKYSTKVRVLWMSQPPQKLVSGRPRSRGASIATRAGADMESDGRAA